MFLKATLDSNNFVKWLLGIFFYSLSLFLSFIHSLSLFSYLKADSLKQYPVSHCSNGVVVLCKHLSKKLFSFSLSFLFYFTLLLHLGKNFSSLCIAIRDRFIDETIGNGGSRVV